MMLAKGGHITPLAQDTLNERRVKVVREGRPSETTRRWRRAPTFGRWRLAATTRAWRCAGTSSRSCEAAAWRSTIWGPTAPSRWTIRTSPRPWPTRSRAAKPTPASSSTAPGIGSAIAANKIDGVRAVMATTETIARYSREHNGANVLTLGATLVSVDEARAIVTTWLTTPMREPRYIRRLAKIRDLENGGGDQFRWPRRLWRAFK